MSGYQGSRSLSASPAFFRARPVCLGPCARLAAFSAARSLNLVEEHLARLEKLGQDPEVEVLEGDGDALGGVEVAVLPVRQRIRLLVLEARNPLGT